MPRDLVPCGHQSAYDRHRARGEEPCDACRHAHRLYNRQRYARRQAAKGLTVQPRGTYRTNTSHYDLQDIAHMIRKRKNLAKAFRIKPDVIRALIHACRQNGLL